MYVSVVVSDFRHSSELARLMQRSRAGASPMHCTTRSLADCYRVSTARYYILYDDNILCVRWW